MASSFSSLNKYSFLILFFYACNQMHAQSSDNDLFYFTGELTAGNYLGIDIHANYLINEKYSFKVGYSGHLREPQSAPYDYSSGLIGAMTFGLTIPYDQLGNYHVMAGRVYSLNKKGTIRVNLSLGVGLAVIKEPTNWQPTGRSFVHQNYSYDYNKYRTLGLIVNPKIEFPFSRYYGLTISPMLQINKDRTYVGIGIGQMLGLLRRETSHSDQ